MLVTLDNSWLHRSWLGIERITLCILNFSGKIKVIEQEEGDGKNLVTMLMNPTKPTKRKRASHPA